MRYQIIDALRGTRTMSAYRKLCNLRLSADELRELQRDRLGLFLLKIKKHNPLYTDLLSEVPGEIICSNPQGVLAQLPVVDKAFIAQNREHLFAPISGRKWQSKKTGGSTGEPFRYCVDLMSVSESWAFTYWCWNRYAGFSPGEPYITVAGSSLQSLGGQLKAKAYNLFQNNYIVPGDLISKDLEINRPKIRNARLLFGYPSSIVALLDAIPDLFLDHRLRMVVTTSEQLLPRVRSFIENKLQVEVYDQYGANDGGLISSECKLHDGYHYDPFNCYVETERNGTTGQNELLLTSLNSLGFPFVRYRVGDVADLDDFGSCSCGNPLPMIRNLSGRTRDVLKLQDGRVVHGVVFNHLFYHFPEVRRYRFVQAKDYHIAIMLDIENFDNWHTTQQRHRVEEELIEILGVTAFSMQPLEKLPGGNHKLKLIESHVS
jgi:phenylacetate-CoA ligase